MMMIHKDKFPKKPPIRFRLTKAQARKIEEAKDAGEDVFVVGYSRRHHWPDNEKFSLVAWFLDRDAMEAALIGSGVMRKRRPAKKKRASRKRSRRKSS